MRANTVIKRVCDALNVSRADLIGADRYRALVDARWICYLLLLDNVKGITKTRIARMFHRDHTTVVHGVQQAKILIKIDDKFQLKHTIARASI